MIRRPPISTRTDTLFPYTTLFRSDRPDGETDEVQRFRSLENSVAAYMRNLNTKTSYREFRDRRAALRDQGSPLDSYQLAGQLQRYSVRGPDYIRTIRSIMRSNALDTFDEAKLADEPRSEERRVGKGCVSPCRSRWSPYH